MDSQIQPRLLDYPAAQEYLGGISRASLKTLTGRGEVEAIRVGLGRTMFTREGLDRYIDRQRTKRAPACVA